MVLMIPVKAGLAVNIGGLYSGPFTIENFTLNTYYTSPSDIISFDETNRSVFNGSGGFGFNAGISVFFNYKLGVGISASFLKTSFDVLNSFNWSWEWWDGDSFSITPKAWTNKGTVSSIPVSFNIIFRAISNEKFKINIFAGPTIYLTSIELDGNGGYADGPLLYDEKYYIDWYDVPMTISSSETVFGGNGGIELEYMLSESMNVYVKANYYYAGDLSPQWEVKGGQYTGEFGNLVANISNPDLLPGYTIPLNLSTFTVGFGIKIYL